QGLDPKRLAVLLAVLDKRAGIDLYKAHVYASAVGGVRVSEPATDLAVVLALVSTHRNRSVPDDIVVCGEVGLAGEVRQVRQLGRRLQEAARLGFERAVVPVSAPDNVAGIHLPPAEGRLGRASDRSHRSEGPIRQLESSRAPLAKCRHDRGAGGCGARPAAAGGSGSDPPGEHGRAHRGRRRS
ncbi:MAG: hypothetical protein E6G57_13875, partial [Actinobacteria bacterium]